MIRISKNTPLTLNNVKKWINEFVTDFLPNLQQNNDFYLNSFNDVLPFAKKLVTISASATLWDNINVVMPSDNDDMTNNFTDGQKETFKRIMELFDKQSISAQDLGVITQGCTYGMGYELAYMSSDENPTPKVAYIDPTHCFIVFDDTVEINSLYGIYFNEKRDINNKTYVDCYVYDDKFVYNFELNSKLLSIRPMRQAQGSCCNSFSYADIEYLPIGITGEYLPNNQDIDFILSALPHNMGRMPITEYFNNMELQGDFEQVKPTIIMRNKINDFAFKDARTIASNIVKLMKTDNTFGATIDEESLQALMESILTKTGVALPSGYDMQILTKQESFSMISVFGNDLDNKIYDLSMIINFTSDEFAGNVTGVALRLKLFPFKKMVSNKDHYIEKLYKRRIKMYLHALSQLDPTIETFDVAELKISIKRTWEENIQELAQTVAQLYSTGLFSHKYLIEKMPDGDYDIEISQKEIENKNATMQADSNNTSTGDFEALIRSIVGG